MNSRDYFVHVLRTAAGNFTDITVRFMNDVNLVHGAVGLSTEANEILDAVKKHIFYGKPIDPVNIKEEIGDCLWYMALIANHCDFTFEEAMQSNIAKLKARYPDQFDETKAIHRDLDTEKEALK